jgi:transcription elongation factor Elf1
MIMFFRVSGGRTNLMLNHDFTIPIPCPKCSHEIVETLARLENNPELTCSSCGFLFRVDVNEVRRELEKLENLLPKPGGKNILKIKF